MTIRYITKPPAGGLVCVQLKTHRDNWIYQQSTSVGRLEYSVNGAKRLKKTWCVGFTWFPPNWIMTIWYAANPLINGLAKRLLRVLLKTVRYALKRIPPSCQLTFWCINWRGYHQKGCKMPSKNLKRCYIVIDWRFCGSAGMGAALKSAKYLKRTWYVNLMRFSPGGTCGRYTTS